jgi:hypothetical protein
MAKGCTWLFGRGASIANGLNWVVPREWYDSLLKSCLCRDHLVERIIQTIRVEMQKPNIHCRPYKDFIEFLSLNTREGYYHNFLTTNWDYLLQQELDLWIENNQPGYAPIFLGTHSSVLHLNGSAEPHYINNRSPFLLEIDGAGYRKQTIEANIAFNKTVWTSYAVFVGMSFECEIDKGLLAALSYHEDNILFGEATLIIVDPNLNNLKRNEENMQNCFPRATILPINMGLEEWLGNCMPELSDLFFS